MDLTNTIKKVIQNIITLMRMIIKEEKVKNQDLRRDESLLLQS